MEKEVDVKESKEDKKEKKRNKKNKDEIVEKGVVFKVQIATSPNKLELKPENFNGVENVRIYEAGGLYRYTVGKEQNMTAANKLQLQLRAKGFKDAFIIAFSDLAFFRAGPCNNNQKKAKATPKPVMECKQKERGARNKRYEGNEGDAPGSK